MRLVKLLALLPCVLLALAACGDNKGVAPDAARPDAEIDAPMPDAAIPDGIGPARATADGTGLDLPIRNVVVTYLKPQIGSTTNDPAGFTIQAQKDGPGLFVSVDPATDTPQVIREYLDRFDKRFIGLTGTPDQLRAAQEAAKVPPAEEGTAESTGSTGAIGHATQMIVYDPDGVARIVYPFGTRQSDWTRDLPRLLGGDVPAETDTE